MKNAFGSLSRRRLLQSAAAGTLISSTGLTAHAQGTRLTPVKVSASIPVFGQAPTFLLKSMKFDNKHGMDVEILQMGGNSSLMVDAVVTGNAAFGCPGTITVLQAIRAGADLMVLGAFCNNQIGAVISKTAMAKIGLTPAASFADKMRAMKGLTIGTNPQGATYTQVFRGYLKKYGLDPDNDVRLVYISDTPALIAGIDQKRFDVIVTASGFIEQAISLGGANMWFSGGSGEIPGSEAEVTTVSIARRDTVEKNPELVKQFVAAMQDGLDAMNNDRDKTAALLYDEYFKKIDPATWKLVLEATKKGFPQKMTFSKAVFDYWTSADPKGAESYKDVDYKKITYGPAQA